MQLRTKLLHGAHLIGFLFTPFKVKEGAETQQMLVEKIVGLQRACARRQEKLDFLEEHVEQVILKYISGKHFCSYILVHCSAAS